MKKLHVSSVSILFAALCLAFTACNQGVTAGNGTGTVPVVIGGETARSVDAAGLPVFDDTNTKITVTGKDGTKLAQGTTSITLQVAAGKKITVKAVVTTAAGEWRGVAEHTVTEGTNTVAVRLSKTPKNMGNILSSVISQTPYGDAKVTFKLASGKELLNDVDIGSNHIIPVIARDGIGRIYVLYDKVGGRHLTRFDVEGKLNCEIDLPPSRIATMTVDAKTGTIFIVGMDSTGSKHAHAVTEKGHNNFTLSNGFGLASIGIDNTIQAAAAYNGTLFFTVSASTSGATMGKNKLVAVKAELSGSTLTLTHKATQELSKLRTDSAFGNSLTNCTGLFADADGVYCLLKEQNLGSGTLYALGQIVRYQYSGSAFTGDTKIGLNPKAAGTDGIPFDAQYFSAPVGFIGYDEENLYIADDGVGIQYVNENYHVTANKNRIAAFNRKTSGLTFTDTDATWYGQKPEYKHPNTPILLWERDPSGTAFRYWTSAAGTDPFSSDNKLFEASASEKPTDIFCYDQEGNLYILWKDGSNNHKVRRFALKADSTYDTAGADSSAIGATPRTPKYIAVDVSDGQNCLYYGSEDGDWRVSKATWSGAFSPSSISSATEVISGITEKMTALAANKDGLFVATKEQSSADVPYTLKIKKYKKDGSPNGEKTIANNEGGDNPTDHSFINYTNTDGTVCGLQVIDGVLYALRQNIEKKQKYLPAPPGHKTDEFRSSGVIYKVGNTDDSVSDTVMSELGKKEADDASRTGYGFYRFIAVKPKKLIIASDGAWGMEGTDPSSQKYQNTDKVLEYDLAGALQHERTSGGSFSKKLGTDGSGFVWQ